MIASGMQEAGHTSPPSKSDAKGCVTRSKSSRKIEFVFLWTAMSLRIAFTVSMPLLPSL
jgi:hypothetical protein